MKSILLIGLGRFGKHIAMELHSLGHQVMAVDHNEERVNEVLSFVTSAQIGDSTSEDFLSSLGVRNFDVCIVAIGNNFQSSLETTSLLKELGARLVVSRAARDVHAKFLLRNGADEVVYPEKQLAKWTAIRCSSDHIRDFVDLDGDHDLFEVDLPDQWAGMSVAQIDIRKQYGINIAITERLNIPSLRRRSSRPVIPFWCSDVTGICRNVFRSDLGGDPMRNLILILLLILFFACIYLIMSRIDQLLNLLRKENLRMEKQRPDPDRQIPEKKDTLD